MYVRLFVASLLLPAIAAGCGSGRPAVVLQPEASPPERLSDWGLVFEHRGRLVVNEAARPYVLNTPLFSDYALKLRAVWMPDGTTAEWRDAGPFEFPVGTVISKTFFYPAAEESGGVPIVHKVADTAYAEGSIDLARYRVLETRLLVRYASGWKALPYVWNEEQTEARLSLAGEFRLLRFDDAADEFTYVVPDVNQCAGCHTTDHSTQALQPIGPRAWQLNRRVVSNGAAADQLEAWRRDGLLAEIPDARPAGLDWSDPDVPVEDRARAYLDSNCAHCHNDRGAADSSALDLRRELAAGRATGVCKPPVAVGRGSGDRPYDIYPGRPDDSILLYRMQHTDPAIAMPELGRSTVHSEAVALIAGWIGGMPGDC